MASKDLIFGYLAQVRAVVGFPRDADAIPAQVEDHPLYAWIQVQLARSSEVTAYSVYAVALVASSLASLIGLAGTLARAARRRAR